MRFGNTQTVCLLGLIAAACAGSALAGPAGFEVTLEEDSGAVDILTASSFSPITLNGTYANIADFDFDNFVLSSSDTSTTGTLTSSGLVISGNGSHTLTIIATEVGFTTPSGAGQMSSVSSYSNFASQLPGDPLSFQSFFAPGQSLFSTADPSPGVLYSPLGNNGNDTEPVTSISVPVGGYTLTNEFIWSNSGGGIVLGMTGTTTVVSSTPEPATFPLALGCMGALLAVVKFRGRRTAR